jgi:hypothetical protein
MSQELAIYGNLRPVAEPFFLCFSGGDGIEQNPMLIVHDDEGVSRSMRTLVGFFKGAGFDFSFSSRSGSLLRHPTTVTGLAQFYPPPRDSSWAGQIGL